MKILTRNLLAPAWDRLYRRSDHVHPFKIGLHNISIPSSSLKVQNGGKTECEIRMVLFDVTYKQFFGKSWMSPRVDVKLPSPSKDVVIAFHKNVYFHTSFADQNIILVIEYTFYDSTSKPSHVLSSGWCFLRIFSQEHEIRDVGDPGSYPFQKLDIYHGSPRSLLFLEEPLEGNKYLQKIINCQLKYQLMTHSSMLRVLHLIPENMFISGNEPLPGLLKDSKSIDYLHTIKIDSGYDLDLDKLVLHFDSVEKFEDELCHLMNADRLNREHVSPDGSELSVFERRLQIGVHNGLSYVQEPQIHHLVTDSGANVNVSRGSFKVELVRSASVISKLSNNSLLVLRNKVNLTDVPENCYIVFLLEYVLSFPIPTFDGRRPSSSASIGRGTTFSVGVGWCNWPVNLKDGCSDVVLSLNGGPSYNVDSLLLYKSNLDVEVDHMKLSFQCSPSSKSDSNIERLSIDYTSRLPLFSASESTSLHEDFVPPSKRPPSAKSVKKMSVMKSPEKKPAISSSSKIGQIEVNEENMHQVSYSASHHLPIIPVLSDKKPVCGPQVLSRAGYAQLYSTNFPPVLDRYGKAPEVMQLGDSSHVSLEKEESDLMKCNEIVIEFLAMSGSTSLFHGQIVKFSFQFYRFPIFESMNLVLQNSSPEESNSSLYPYILYKANKDGLKQDYSEPGLNVRYDADAQFLHDDEHPVFLKYMEREKMFIDVWDVNSMFLIGTVVVPLKSLLRQGKNAIQIICELDVSKNSYNSGEDARQTPLVESFLHMRFVNVGRPINPVMLKEKQKINKKSIGTNHIRRQYPLIDEDQQLLNHLKSYSNVMNEEISEEHKQKLARMNAVRAKKSIIHIVEDKMLNIHQNKLEMLKIIDEYRNQHKDKIIRNVLNKAVTKTYAIYPLLGNVDVLLHPLANHGNQPETVIIESSCPHIKFVTNYSEWLTLKGIFNFKENLEEDTFSYDNQSLKLFMRSNEKIILPIKYQQVLIEEEIVNHINDNPPSLMTEANDYKITVKKNSDGKIVSILNISVRPQPIHFNQSLKFHHPENSFFKTFLQVPSNIKGQLSVRCSNKHVVCGIESADNSYNKSIYTKVSSGCANTYKTFFVFLYNDSYASRCVYAWKITVYFVQKVDVCCTQGQTSRTSLILRGHQVTKTVKVNSSDSNLVAVEPAQAFVLPAGVLQEIHLGIRVMEAGSRYFQVNVIDQEHHTIFKSWLVYVRTEIQSVGKAFQVNLSIGCAKAAKKRVKFKNPYPVRKTFTVQTNRTDLLQIKDNRFELDGGESYSLGLYFLPCQKKTTVEVLVFINNMKDENEETFCIRAVFS